MFIAEAYWDLEWALQQQGFDFCYDKRLYDRLVHDGAEEVRGHLTADRAYQQRLLRFIENHDEPRAAATFPGAKARAAAVVALTQTGARLVHQGQVEGRRSSCRCSSTAAPTSRSTSSCKAFYERLLGALCDPVFRTGQWQLGEAAGWNGNDSWHGPRRLGLAWRIALARRREPSATGPRRARLSALGRVARADLATSTTPQATSATTASGDDLRRWPLRVARPLGLASLQPCRQLAPPDRTDPMPKADTLPSTAEHARLAEATGRAEDDLFAANPWYEWGPYLSERAWGTVREDYSPSGDAWDSFPHDHARSRAYRWNEDGMAGISDIRHELCLALALWNGSDPILKERMFGLTGPQGNHGEDVKEYWWYLDGLPSHALLRWRYHYPQAAFPYEQLVDQNGRAASTSRSSNCSTPACSTTTATGSVEVTYAKASPTEVLDPDRGREPRARRGDPGRAADPLVPQHLVVGRRRRAPADLGRRRRRSVVGRPPPRRLPARGCAGPRRCGRRSALFCDNETNAPRVFGSAATHAVPQGRHQRPRRRTAPPRSTPTGTARRPRCATGSRSPAAARPSCGCGCTGPATDGRPQSSPGLGKAVRQGASPPARPRPTSSTPRSPPPARRRGRCGCCARRAPGWSGASRCTPTTWPAGSTATRQSRRRREAPPARPQQ